MGDEADDEGREHYTSIDPSETRHEHPDCGCALEREEDGTVRYYPCAMHDAADDLLAALRSMVGHADAIRLLRRPLNADELNHLKHSEAMARAIIEGIDKVKFKPVAPLPKCPRCNGETESNGSGGVSCFFCGYSGPSVR